MPVSFEPVATPRFDQSLLAYLGRNFEKLQKAIASLSNRSIIPPQVFLFGVANGVANVFTVLQANNAILTAPFPLKMVVQITGDTGFSAQNAGVDYQIQDQAGVPISPNTAFILNGIRISSNAEIRTFAMQAHKDYDINQVCGFRFAYKVDAVAGMNVYNDSIAVVSFWPRG